MIMGKMESMKKKLSNESFKVYERCHKVEGDLTPDKIGSYLENLL